MAELPFTPMVGNLIALLQLAGTTAFGSRLVNGLVGPSHWLLALAIGMIVISQCAYLVTFFSSMYWILNVLAWGLLVCGIWAVARWVSQQNIRTWFTRPVSPQEWLVLLLSSAFVLLALGPPTQADALEYHWGIPMYLLRHQQWPPTGLWLHGSLGGIGEIYITLGMLLHAENLSTLLQAIGVVGFAHWITRDIPSTRSGFLKLFILASPVMLFFVTGPKPQLFPQVITAIALYLTVKSERLTPTMYTLILLLLCGAAQQKLSFVLSGGVVGLFASYKAWSRHPHSILLAIGLVVLFFGPRSWWNWQQVKNPELLTLFTPLPSEFISQLQAYREQDWWFPFNLIFPDSLGSISAVVGIQIVLALTIRSRHHQWIQVAILTLVAVLLTFIIGQPIARSFYEFVLWIVVGMTLSDADVMERNFVAHVLKLQGFAVLGMAAFGLLVLMPGVFSSTLRLSVMERSANEYRAVKWANDHLSRDAVVLFAGIRSVAFLNNTFVSASWIDSLKLDLNQYYDTLRHQKVNFALVKGNSQSHPLNKCFGDIHAGPMKLTQATRNPFNQVTKYTVSLYHFNVEKLPECTKK